MAAAVGRVGLGERVVGAEILDRGIADGEAPVDLVRAGVGRTPSAALFPYTALFRSRGRDADAVRVGQVDVAEREMAAGGGRKRILGDRRRLSGGGDGRRVFEIGRAHV